MKLQCPALDCDYECEQYDLLLQGAHLDANHPEVQEQRLKKAGLFPPPITQREYSRMRDAIIEQYGGQELVAYEHSCAMLRMGTDKYKVVELVTKHMLPSLVEAAHGALEGRALRLDDNPPESSNGKDERPYSDPNKPGRFDVDGIEWWACDPYPTWYRYDDAKLIVGGGEWPDEVLLTKIEFENLLDYSHSLPTGKTIGKQWKAKNLGGWWLGEYIKDPNPEMVGIRWRKIVVCDS